MSFSPKRFLVSFKIAFTSFEKACYSGGGAFWISSVTAPRMIWSLVTWDHSLMEFLRLPVIIVFLLILVLISRKLLIAWVTDVNNMISALATKTAFHVVMGLDCCWCIYFSAKYLCLNFKRCWVNLDNALISFFWVWGSPPRKLNIQVCRDH